MPTTKRPRWERIFFACVQQEEAAFHMSFPDTMGWAPNVTFESDWPTMAGRREFLRRVARRLQQLLQLAAPPDLEWHAQMRDALTSALRIDPGASTTTSSIAIDDAVEYMAVALRSHAHMRARLATMCKYDAHSQPRGANGAERKHDAVLAQPGGNGNAYARYVAQQRALATRFG